MQQNITLALRSPAKITLDGIKPTYCQLTDSHGVKLPLTIGKCEYDIAIVTPYHDGLWKARYGLNGRLIPVEVDIMITTYGETLESSNEKSETDAKRTFPSRGNLLLSIHKGPDCPFRRTTFQRWRLIFAKMEKPAYSRWFHKIPGGILIVAVATKNRHFPAVPRRFFSM